MRTSATPGGIAGKGDVAAAREARRGFLDAGANQRLGLRRPRHADLDVLGGDLRHRVHLRGQRGHHRRTVRDRARHRSHVVEAGSHRKTALHRDQAKGRLESDDATACGRGPNRASRVRAERSVGQARRERRRRTPTGAAGDPAGAKRIGHGAVVGILRGQPEAELVQVGLPHQHVTGSLQPPDRLGGSIRDVVGEDRCSVGRTNPCGVEDVLDREARAVAFRVSTRVMKIASEVTAWVSEERLERAIRGPPAPRSGCRPPGSPGP